jgi:hypothetical protein
VTSQNLLQDEVIEDNTTSSIENDNSADQLKQENDPSLENPLKNDSASIESSSPVEKKKRNRCTWETCNKKLGLTGKISI